MPFLRLRQEKDTFEEEEADDLINFVENLDFDKFVDALVGMEKHRLDRCLVYIQGGGFGVSASFGRRSPGYQF